MTLWVAIESRLSQHLGRPLQIRQRQAAAGGCINEAWLLSTSAGRFFLKLNQPQRLEIFEAEAEALHELAATAAIRVPTVLGSGTVAGRSYLLLEALELSGSPDPVQFGRQLAQLHLHAKPYFGWHRHNWIGSTVQRNTASLDWPEFFAQQRLGVQLELVSQRGVSQQLAENIARLQAQLPAFFSDYRPRPSLLHGDLWAGNWAADAQCNAVIFDPACYYGDHEADLAMMELFGSPGSVFFDAYAEIFPIDSGYKARRDLYNLYHVLNHYVLFGGSYASQAGQMLHRLLAAV